MKTPTQSKLALRFRLSGRVQGVGFRYFAEHWAIRFQVRGYVRNLREGDVEVYAIGTAEQLAEFKEKLLQGPPMARVTHVEEAPASVDPHSTFFQIEGD